MSLLVLLPTEANPVPEEGRGKENSGRPRSSIGSKVVLILLTKVVAVYVGLSMVYVWGTGFQLLLEHLGDDGSWDGGGSGSGTRASRTALKIRYKSSSEYLRILIAAGGELARGFPPKGQAG